ncbi:hypothetical protein [Streptosporangium lutulentum]|uniref:Uncharacterized protein n=1 Tax=Streptosporangium lutulentum TaxID=1461250 RepID=A0ABT9Q8S9_9ACTN|nr:hypothetical protein [Streptosporangium lutulentum]MDP9842810.1 hypothetical protein [Streptosporangium lutulentum]
MPDSDPATTGFTQRSTAGRTALTTLCEPGAPMPTLAGDDEPARRQGRRAPRPS